MIVFILLAILFFLVFVGLQMLIYRVIVKTALNKYIEPKLKEKGSLFIDYKWPGLLSNGDFKADDVKLTVMNKNGNVSNSTYAYIFYKKSNDIKKITVRINTTFWTIDSIVYSSEF